MTLLNTLNMSEPTQLNTTSTSAESANPRMRVPAWVTVWFAALIALTIAVRVADPTGWLGSDDSAYYSAAEHLLTGDTIHRVHHQFARSAVIVPVAVSIYLFGETPGAVALPMVVASTLCVILVAVLGRLVWSWWEGLLAATIVSMLPYFRVLSSTAYPDVHACLWTVLAVVLAMAAMRTRSRRYVWVLGIACGASVGLAMSAKIFSVTVGAAIVVILLRPLRPHARTFPSIGRFGRVQSASICTETDKEPGRASGYEDDQYINKSAIQPRTKRVATKSETHATRRPERPFAIPHDQVAHRRMIALGSMVLGGLLFFLADGFFYLWAADDFLYKYHALSGAQSDDSLFVSTAGLTVTGWVALAWQRFTLLFYPSTSGWGLVGVAFWPAIAWALVFCKAGRALAVWAIAAYLVVALMPISLRNGPAPCPVFHGRHILTACVPFALCLAWILRGVTLLALRPAWIERGWPVKFGWPIALGALAVLSYTGGRELSGFRDRPTGRVGQAIGQIVASMDWDDNREIFMPASLYLRHRILFPPELRPRLRVAVDDHAPPWWRDASPDIVERRAALPPPGEAYLIATPRQLTGEAEAWDYGVTLPIDQLEAWRSTPSSATARRFKDKTIGINRANDDDDDNGSDDGSGGDYNGDEDHGEAILVLLADQQPDTYWSREAHHDSDLG